MKTGWTIRAMNEALVYVGLPLAETGNLLTREEALDLVVELILAMRASDQEVTRRLDARERAARR